MDADEGIEQGERPEADQRKFMGIERIAYADRQEVVDQHVTRGRDPESDDVVDVEAVESGAVDARDRVGQDEAAQHEIHRRPHEGPDQIPQRDIERRLEALRDGEEELCRRRRDDDEDGDLGEQRELARLQAVILGERQRDEPRRHKPSCQSRH